MGSSSLTSFLTLKENVINVRYRNVFEGPEQFLKGMITMLPLLTLITLWGSNKKKILLPYETSIVTRNSLIF